VNGQQTTNFELPACIPAVVVDVQSSWREAIIPFSTVLRHRIHPMPDKHTLAALSAVRRYRRRRTMQAWPDKQTLLTLPGEIRNHIYRLAMFDSDDKQPFLVSVDGVMAPPMLYTCKVIHREATGISFAEAKFAISMDSLDPEPLVRLCNRLRKLPKVVPLSKKLNVSFGLFFTRDWGHIRRWLQLYYNKQMRMMLLPPTEEDRAIHYYFPSQGSHLEFLIIGSIFETVDRVMGKFSWTEVEAIIEPQHTVLTDVDKGWA